MLEWASINNVDFGPNWTTISPVRPDLGLIEHSFKVVNMLQRSSQKSEKNIERFLNEFQWRSHWSIQPRLANKGLKWVNFCKLTKMVFVIFGLSALELVYMTVFDILALLFKIRPFRLIFS